MFLWKFLKGDSRKREVKNKLIIVRKIFVFQTKKKNYFLIFIAQDRMRFALKNLAQVSKSLLIWKILDGLNFKKMRLNVI